MNKQKHTLILVNITDFVCKFRATISKHRTSLRGS